MYFPSAIEITYQFDLLLKFIVVLITNLAVGWIDDGAEDPAKFAHVSIVGRKLVDVEALGMKGPQGDMTRIHPITYSRKVQDPLPVQSILGLESRFLRHILHKSVSFVVTCRQYEKNLVTLPRKGHGGRWTYIGCKY
jgi:hypothetical protein